MIEFRLSSLAFIALAFCETSADAADVVGSCPGAEPPVLVQSLVNVKGNPLAIKVNAQTFVLKGNCVILDRSRFSGSVNFILVNRFDEQFAGSTGLAFVKSTKRFSNIQDRKIKVFRNRGWYLDNRELFLLPSTWVNIELKKWDELHGDSSENPEDMKNKLGLPWHAYGNPERLDPSTDEGGFWKLIPGFDPTYDAVTNYLLRFQVRTDGIPGEIPFEVVIQPQVSFFRLSIQSNLEVFAGDFWFMLQ